MALSPSIPTSFVPKQPVETGRRRYSKGTNLFLVVAIAIFILSSVLAVGVFLYSTYLQHVEQIQSQQVASAEQQANAADVDDFVRLQDRLTAAKQLLSQHIVLSQFFTLLENITVQNVSFDTLSVQVAQDRTAAISMAGTAEDINSLAAESTAFASAKQIKNAVFSGIQINGQGVSFQVNASLDPTLVEEASAPTSPALSANGSTTAPIQTIQTSALETSTTTKP